MISGGILDAGGVVEFGTVTTDKNWHRDYKTVYKMVTTAMLSGTLGGYVVISNAGDHTTFSDFAGPITEVSAEGGIISLSMGWSTTYKSYGIGFGPSRGFPSINGNLIVGFTTYISEPYYHDENAGTDPDVGHVVH